MCDGAVVTVLSVVGFQNTDVCLLLTSFHLSLCTSGTTLTWSHPAAMCRQVKLLAPVECPVQCGRMCVSQLNLCNLLA